MAESPDEIAVPNSEKAEPIYKMTDLIHRYGQRQVLRIDHLQIYRGEILALVGPSGAGKSTFLRLLNFLESPTSGELHFANDSFKAGEKIPISVRRRITTVFQRPHLLNRTVAANVQYGLKLRNGRNGHNRVKKALEQVGLANLARQRARTLSGGEAQRVALARALVIRPDVLLLDEPTANLDPYNVGLIEQIVLETNQQREMTVVLVTHNVFQARRLAHRVALMLDGRIVEITDVETFFEDPANPITAAFISGAMIY